MSDPQEIGNTGVAADELKQFIERWERIQEAIDDERGTQKDLGSEIKGRGFDLKQFKELIKLRKKDRDQRHEEEAILDLYKQAVGID